MTVTDSGVTVAELVSAVRRQHTATPVVPRDDGVSLARRVAVRAAHPGAGASSVAVAILDALASCGVESPTLIDAMATAPSGVFGAAEVEIDSGHPEWRGGRRGRSRLLRPAAPGNLPRDWPDAAGVTVIDGPSFGSASRSVLACQATVPSLRFAEAAMAEIEDLAAVAIVGASRWPKVLEPALSPAIKTKMAAGAVVFVPHHRELKLFGIDAEPTPRHVLAAALDLVGLLWPDLGDLSHPGPRRGLRR